MSFDTQQGRLQNKQSNSNSKKGQYIKLGGQKGYSLLQGLLILAIISIVVTIALNYFS
jgi:hypothetical protein